MKRFHQLNNQEYLKTSSNGLYYCTVCYVYYFNIRRSAKNVITKAGMLVDFEVASLQNGWSQMQILNSPKSGRTRFWQLLLKCLNSGGRHP